MMGNVLLSGEYSFCTKIVKKLAYLTNVHLEDPQSGAGSSMSFETEVA